MCSIIKTAREFFISNLLSTACLLPVCQHYYHYYLGSRDSIQGKSNSVQGSGGVFCLTSNHYKHFSLIKFLHKLGFSISFEVIFKGILWIHFWVLKWESIDTSMVPPTSSHLSPPPDPYSHPRHPPPHPPFWLCASSWHYALIWGHNTNS